MSVGILVAKRSETQLKVTEYCLVVMAAAYICCGSVIALFLHIATSMILISMDNVKLMTFTIFVLLVRLHFGVGCLFAKNFIIFYVETEIGCCACVGELEIGCCCLVVP